MKRTVGIETTASTVLSRWDTIIRQQSYIQWRKLSPASCDAEDIAQEVRLVFWRNAERIAAAENPVSYVTRAARQEAIKALRRLCREELGNSRVYIEDLPGICDLFYSSSRCASGAQMD